MKTHERPSEPTLAGAGGAPAWFLGAALVGTTFVVLVAWSWMVWPDPVVDFGRELYVAWRVSAGDILYRDVAYFNGPLSPYWNAMWFTLFGSSIHLLLFVNGVVAAAFLAVLFRLLWDMSGVGAATVGCLAVLLLTMIVPRTPDGAFTFLAPYSHEATHGLLILVTAVLAFGRAVQARKVHGFILGGLLVGASLLTKPEIAVATVGVSFTALVLSIANDGFNGPWRTHLAAIVLGSTSILLLAGGLLAIHLGWVDAIRGLATPLISAATPEVRVLEFYKAMAGTKELGWSLSAVALSFLGVGVVFGLPWLALREVGFGFRSPALGHLALAIAFVAGVIPMVAMFVWLPWWRCFSSLPVFLLLFLVAEFTGKSVLAGARQGGGPRSTQALFLVASILLLLKIPFNTTVLFYGFFLATLGIAALVIVIFDTLPRLMAVTNPSGARVFRIYACGALSGIVGIHLAVASVVMSQRTVEVGEGSDRFFADVYRGPVLQSLLLEIAQRVPTGAVMASVPEGSMANYLSRHATGTPYTNLLPPEEVMFGETAIYDTFASTRPEWLLVWDRKMALYGVMGVDYGVGLSEWIEQTYSTQWERLHRVPWPDDAAETDLWVRLMKRSD